MNILITGKPGVGKTTLISCIIKECPSVSGFFTREIRDKERGRLGFAIETCEGKRGVLSHVDVDSPLCVSKYRVNLKDIDNIAVPSLNLCSDVLVIDEIGKMELFSELFRKRVTEALDTGKVVATILEKPHPFTDAIKRRKDITLYRVTEENRDALVDIIRKEIQKR